MPPVFAAPDFEQTLQGPECPDRFYILADDLTGACDAAAAFLRTGHPLRVWLDSRNLSPAPGVQAFTTASRNLSPSDAAVAVYSAASALSEIPRSLIFKKIDSALRGQIAAELLAAHQALHTRAILLAPAFPAAGRRVCGGFLKIRDAAGEHDPVCIVISFQQRWVTPSQKSKAPDKTLSRFSNW